MKFDFTQKEALKIQGVLESLKWEQYTLTKTISNLYHAVPFRTPPDTRYVLDVGNTGASLSHMISLFSALEQARQEANKEET